MPPSWIVLLSINLLCSNALGKSTLEETFEPGFTLGVGVGTGFIRAPESGELALADTQFSAWTAENCMKPQPLQPQEGRFEFEMADRFVELAEKHNKRVIGHTLVWHLQSPDWFFLHENGEPAEASVVEARMKTHICKVVSRFRGRVAEWDVVNEAVSDREDEFLRPTKWLEALGEGYIATAFRTAHEADPDALLIYNDYNIEQPGKREKTVRLLRSLLDHGVPIHGVGIQGHWEMGHLPLRDIEDAIREFSALGLRVMITELDVSVLPQKYWGSNVSLEQARQEGLDPFTEGLPDEIAEKQAELYGSLFEVFWRQRDKIDRVTFWNLHDGVSWKNEFPIRGRTDHPVLFDRQLKPKPAFHTVISVPATSEE